MRPKESGAAKAVNLQRENMEKKASFFLPHTTRSKKAATFFVPRTTHSKAAGTPPAHPLLIAGAGGAGAGFADINVVVQNEEDEAETVDARENEAETAQSTVDARAVSFIRASNIASGAPAYQCGKKVAV